MNSSDVPPISKPHLSDTRYPGQPPSKPAAADALSRGSDQFELSSRGAQLAHLLNLAHQLPEVRADKVDQAKARLEQGAYDQPGVLDQAVDNLELEGDLEE